MWEKWKRAIIPDSWKRKRDHGAWVWAYSVTCCFVYKASILRPAMAFLSIVQQVMYMGLFFALFTPIRRLFPLHQMYLIPFNAGRITLSWSPTFAKIAAPSEVSSTSLGASCFCRFLHHKCDLCSLAFGQLKEWSCACFCQQSCPHRLLFSHLPGLQPWPTPSPNSLVRNGLYLPFSPNLHPLMVSSAVPYVVSNRLCSCRWTKHSGCCLRPLCWWRGFIMAINSKVFSEISIRTYWSRVGWAAGWYGRSYQATENTEAAPVTFVSGICSSLFSTVY